MSANRITAKDQFAIRIIFKLIVCLVIGLVITEIGIGRVAAYFVCIPVLLISLLPDLMKEADTVMAKGIELDKKDNGKRYYKSLGNKPPLSTYVIPEGKPSILDPAVPVSKVIQPVESHDLRQYHRISDMKPKRIIPAERAFVELSCIKCGGTGLRYDGKNYICQYCGTQFKLCDLTGKEDN